jgi:hypothetical protein
MCEQYLISELSLLTGTFWCLHLPPTAPAEREQFRQEVIAQLNACTQGRGQKMLVATRAEPHGGLRSLFVKESCAEWLWRETGMSARQVADALAEIESFGVYVVGRKLCQIAFNPSRMLGYAAARFQQPDVLAYETHGMDPSGVQAAHRYMKVVAERCCAIHLSPVPGVPGQSCPSGMKCVAIRLTGP